MEFGSTTLPDGHSRHTECPGLGCLGVSQASERLAQLPDAQAQAINCILPDHANTNSTSAIPHVGAVVTLRLLSLVTRNNSPTFVVEGTSTTVARPKTCETNQSPRPTPTSPCDWGIQGGGGWQAINNRPPKIETDQSPRPTPQARVIGGSRGGEVGKRSMTA